MDRKIKKNEAIDKKTDHRIKDGGDSKKFEKSQIMAEHNNMKVVYLERGDSGERDILDHREPQQIRLNNDRKKPHDDIKSKYLTHGTAEKDFPQKKTNVQGPINKDLLGKSHSEIRKRIRDKYTFKLNVPVNKSDHLSLYRNRKGATIKLSCDGSSPPLTIKMPPDPIYVRPGIYNYALKLSRGSFFACFTRCMNVNEAKRVCNNRTWWFYFVSVYPLGKKA